MNLWLKLVLKLNKEGLISVVLGYGEFVAETESWGNLSLALFLVKCLTDFAGKLEEERSLYLATAWRFYLSADSDLSPKTRS